MYQTAIHTHPSIEMTPKLVNFAPSGPKQK